MTLTDVYKQSRQGGGGGRLASAVLDAQHWFCSLSDFDPRSGEPLPRALTRVLSEISAGAAIRNSPPRDRLWCICRHCGMALRALYRTPNEEPFRVHELLHVRDVRELDVQSFVKLSMRPGLNVRQKLAGNPHLDAVRHTMTLDLPENRLLKACSEELEHRLDAKEVSVGLTPEEADLLDKIKSWLHSDAPDAISRWTDLPPNNTLLSHREYRRVWDAWRQLGRLDEETAGDITGMSKIVEGILFWNGMAEMRRVNGVGMAEVPLVFDSASLSIVPFGKDLSSAGIPVVVMESEDKDTVQGRIVPYGMSLPKMTENAGEMEGVLLEKESGPVCFDPSSPLPVYSTDGTSAKTLRHFLVWQRWCDTEKSQSADVGCFGADGVWTKDGIETVVPMDVFFQDRHERSVLDIAFRTMVEFLKGSYFSGESFIWLAPDFLDEFTLGLPRWAFNASFSAAEPLPRSIAAVVAQIPYDSVQPDDSILVIDQLGGVVYATKVIASYDEALAAAVPETHGIRWTRYPSVILRDERAKRGVDPELPVVNESGEWTFSRTSNSINPIDYLNKAEELLGHCIERILATNPQAPLTCGGFRVHVLQQKAGDLAIWRDQLPALSMGGVIVDGMYGDFTLVDASSQSIRPVRGQAVSIPVPQLFNLPKLKAVFPLHQDQGEGRQTLDYVAEVDFPPQVSSTPCRLDLRYTYGADEPYSLDFIPVKSGLGIPRRLHAKWKPFSKATFAICNKFTHPSFPPLKDWSELRSFPKKDGNGTTDLISRALDLLSCCDPIKLAEENLRYQKLKRREKKIQQFHKSRVSGTITATKWGQTDRMGKRYFFVETNDGEVFCHENDLRDSGVLDSLAPGSMVWFSTFVNKKTGRVQTRDIATDESLPESSLPRFLKREAWEPTATELSELALLVHQRRETFLADNENRIGWRLDALRFPLIVIMHGARALSAPDFPNDLRMAIAQANSCLEKGISNPTLSEGLQSKILQYFSYLHSFAPPSFQRWALQYARTSPLLMHWRKLAYCLGDLSQNWQQEILSALSDRLSVPADSRLILSLFGISAWRSPLFLDRMNSQTIRLMVEQLPEALAVDMKRLTKCSLPNKTNDERAKKKWFFAVEPLALHLELSLALLRINSETGVRFASVLTPGSLPTRNFVGWIDDLTLFLHEREVSLPFRVSLETKKPSDLCNTPDFLYALRCYLTGDDGANAISITSIDEGSDSDDA